MTQPLLAARLVPREIRRHYQLVLVSLAEKLWDLCGENKSMSQG